MNFDKNKMMEVLEGLGDAFGKEKIDLYKSIIEKSNIKKITTIDDFFFSLIYPYESFLENYILSEICNNSDVEFILIKSQFIELAFQNIFETFEGRAFCADKSSAIMSGLISFYKDGHKIEFDYSQEYTFHLPINVFKTHDEIISFYEGLKSLYYGNNKKYLIALKNIIDNIEKNKDE